MIQYNLDKLVKIKVFEKKEETWRPKYQKQLSVLGVKLLSEGIIGIMGSFTPISEMSDYYPHHVLEDGKLFEKPELRLYFGTEVCGIYLDTKEQCIEKANEIMQQAGKWFKLS